MQAIKVIYEEKAFTAVEPELGEHLSKVLSEVVELARLGKKVVFKFNGIALCANERSTAESLYGEFLRQHEISQMLYKAEKAVKKGG